MLREIKPKSSRSARALRQREAQLVENPKKALFLKSTSSSSLSNGIAADLYALKRPLAIKFTKKNLIHPYEDASSLEFFSEKNDTSLLCFTSHSKKRPHNLTLARTFNAKVLDMLECLADSESARLMAQFSGAKSRVGSKPLLTFTGSQFDDEAEHAAKFRLARSLFLDFFRGENTSKIDVEGLQTMISFTASETQMAGEGLRQKVHVRVWRIVTRRSDQRTPRVELEEMGPRIDFRLGRARFADSELLKEALKRPVDLSPKTRKNVETDLMGDKLGRIHLPGQDLKELQTRKMKGLKRSRHDETSVEEDRISQLEGVTASEDSIDDNMFSDGDSESETGEGVYQETSQERAAIEGGLNKKPRFV